MTARSKFLLVSVVSLFFVLLGLALGQWQLGRAAQKIAWRNSMLTNIALPVFDNRMFEDHWRLAGNLHRRVHLQGHWKPADTVFLDNRTMTGRVGLVVVTPFQLEPSGSVVLIQRGWIARNFLDRSILPAVTSPDGLIELTGVIAPAPSKHYALGGPETGRIRQNLDVTSFSAEKGLDLAPVSVQQTGDLSDGLLRDWPQPDANVNTNYGYAFQWFTLSCLAAAYYLWFQIVKRFRRKTATDNRQTSPPTAWGMPLTMTVSSMPSPDDALALQSHQTRRGRRWMLVVWLICASPVIASYLAFYVFRPQVVRSFGELIEPQRALPDMAGDTLDGKRVNLKTLQGQWLLVSVSGGACDAVCQQHLYLQRQLRESTGKDKERVDWVWLISDQTPVSPALLPALGTADVLRVPEAELKQWLSPAADHQLADHLYVVDPMGHWMMRFPANLNLDNAAQAKRDLDRLLRASTSWDQPGRPAKN